MSRYRYTNTHEHVYVDRALVVGPGDVVEWGEPPADSHWEQVSDDTPTTAELRAAAAEAEQDEQEHHAAAQEDAGTEHVAAGQPADGQNPPDDQLAE